MKLGTKLIIYLVGATILTMMVHGYLSIRQDRANLAKEIRMGMGGFSRSIQAALRGIYADRKSIQATQRFIDRVGAKGNIHGVIVYDLEGKPVVTSVSLKDTKGIPGLNPKPILEIDPKVVLREGQGTNGYIREGRQLIYYRIEPIYTSDDQLVGAFLLARQGSSLARTLEFRTNRILVVTFALALVLCVLILLIVHRNVNRPIHQLIERIREIGKGNWDQRVSPSGPNEIISLAEEFNRMSERLQETYAELLKEQEAKLRLEKDLRHSDRLASVGQLAAGLAHEIGTPLNIIGGRAEHLLRRQRSAEEITENLQTIRSQMDRIAGIVRQLLEFSRRKEPSLRPVDITSLLPNVQRLLQHKIEEKGVLVEMRMTHPIPTIQADPDLLQQVFINLYLNSLQAMKRGGRIKIKAEVPSPQACSSSANPEEDGWVRISFEDDGEGIPSEDVEHVFDPFFTTKDVGQGTGLGLSVSYGIVKDHGGEIRVESKEGEFTRFTIDLPVASDHAISEKQAVGE